MKKTVLFALFVIFTVSATLYSCYTPIYDYTWRVYFQDKPGGTCPASDSNVVSWGSEYVFKPDGNVYDRFGSTKKGTYSCSGGSLDLIVYITSGDTFELSYTSGSLMMLGSTVSTGKNVFAVRGNRI